MSNFTAKAERGSAIELEPCAVFYSQVRVEYPLTTREMNIMCKGERINVFVGKRPDLDMVAHDFPVEILNHFSASLRLPIAEREKNKNHVIILPDLKKGAVGWFLRWATHGGSDPPHNPWVNREQPTEVDKLHVLLTMGINGSLERSMMRSTLDGITSGEIGWLNIKWLFRTDPPGIITHAASQVMQHIVDGFMNGTITSHDHLRGCRQNIFFWTSMHRLVQKLNRSIGYKLNVDQVPLTREQVEFILNFTNPGDKTREVMANGLARLMCTLNVVADYQPYIELSEEWAALAERHDYVNTIPDYEDFNDLMVRAWQVQEEFTKRKAQGEWVDIKLLERLSWEGRGRGGIYAPDSNLSSVEFPKESDVRPKSTKPTYKDVVARGEKNSVVEAVSPLMSVGTPSHASTNLLDVNDEETGNDAMEEQEKAPRRRGHRGRGGRGGRAGRAGQGPYLEHDNLDHSVVGHVDPPHTQAHRESLQIVPNLPSSQSKEFQGRDSRRYHGLPASQGKSQAHSNNTGRVQTNTHTPLTQSTGHKQSFKSKINGVIASRPTTSGNTTFRGTLISPALTNSTVSSTTAVADAQTPVEAKRKRRSRGGKWKSIYSEEQGKYIRVDRKSLMNGEVVPQC